MHTNLGITDIIACIREIKCAISTMPCYASVSRTVLAVKCNRAIAIAIVRTRAEQMAKKRGSAAHKTSQAASTQRRHQIVAVPKCTPFLREPPFPLCRARIPGRNREPTKHKSMTHSPNT